jgi:photosystem II protein
MQAVTRTMNKPGHVARPVSGMRRVQVSKPMVACDASLQFILGVDEPCVPEIKLMRSRTGSSGTAEFSFDNPSIFQASGEMGDITGLFLVDDEGSPLTTTDVKAKFVNGKPQIIEAKLNLKSSFEWDRFIRFMDKYSEDNNLGFEKKEKK